MTTLLERAIQAARSLPPETQDEIALAILQLAAPDEVEPVSLTEEECRAISESLAAAERGEFASPAEVDAVWVKHGL